MRYSRNAGRYECVGRSKIMGTASVEEQRTILLVEDDEDQVVLAMRALRNHGIVSEVDEVLVAGAGGEALDYLFGEGGYAGRDTRLTPDFVLLDVDLPGMVDSKS